MPRRIPLPARWSDGSVITAHDFVESWRRVADPATAAPKGFLLYCVANAEDIGAGRCAPEELGVIAMDDFTFQVNLRGPTSFFLRLTSNPALPATPRHTIRIHKDAWTDPGHIVCWRSFFALPAHCAMTKSYSLRIRNTTKRSL